MNTTLFETELNLWLDDVREWSLKLQAEGVPSERCIGIAQHIADGRSIKRALQRQSLGGVPHVVLRAPHGAQS